MGYYFAGGLRVGINQIVYIYNSDTDKIDKVNFGSIDILEIIKRLRSYGVININQDGSGKGFNIIDKGLWSDISSVIIVTEEKQGDNKLYGWVDKYSGSLIVGDIYNACRYKILNYSLVENKYLRKHKEAEVFTRKSKQYEDTAFTMPFTYLHPMIKQYGFERVLCFQTMVDFYGKFNELKTIEVFVSKYGAAYLDLLYSVEDTNVVGMVSGHLTFHCKKDVNERINLFDYQVQANFEGNIMNCITDIRNNCFKGYDYVVKKNLLLKKPVVNKEYGFKFYDDRLFNTLVECYISEVSKQYFKTDSLNFYTWSRALLFERVYDRFNLSGRKFFKPMYDCLKQRYKFLSKQYPLGKKELDWINERLDSMVGLRVPNK